MPIWIDSHSHLDMSVFDEHRNDVVQKAQQAGVHYQIIPSTQVIHFEKTLNVCHQHQGLFPALGLHPYWIHTHHPNDLTLLEEMILQHPQIIGVGECGLDLWIENPEIEKQKTFFEAHCKLAEKYQLPLIMHARKSVDLLTQILSRYPTLKGVVHSFSGSLQQAERLIERGFVLGFGGALTYARAKKLRHIITQIPDHALIIETDSPDQPHAGVQNRPHQPSDLPFIANEIAKLRNQSIEQIATMNQQNVQSIFNKIQIS